MASFDWLLWNHILLFEELSGGDTWRRICRGRSESVRGGGGCFFAGRQLGEAVSELPGDILRGGFFAFGARPLEILGGGDWFWRGFPLERQREFSRGEQEEEIF